MRTTTVVKTFSKLFRNKNKQNCWVLNKARCFSSGGTSTNSDEFIVRSPSADLPSISGATIVEYIRSRVEANWGSRPAYECALTGFKLTHDQVWRSVRGFAAALLKTNLKKGDTVSIVLPNHPFYASALLGIIDAGFVASTVSPSYTPDEMARQLIDSNTKWVVTIPLFAPIIKAAQKTNPNLQGIIVIGEPVDGCHSFTEMIKTDPTGANFLKGSEIDTNSTVAVLPYSSGTTGLPKGVMLTHDNLANHLYLLLQPGVLKFNDNTDTPDRLLGLLPMFHCYGMTNFIFVNIGAGTFTAVLPKFEPATFLQAIRQYKPSILHLVTPLINFIVASPEFGKKEFEETHTIVGAAAPIGPWLVKQVLAKAEKYFFFQEAYGLTETSPATHTLRENTNNTKIGSCGVPLPNTICKIVATDGSGKSLGPNERGELWIKGPQVMKGYWKNQKATNDTVDAQGWIHTGDIAYYDNDDHFYIVDRLKELIKVRGYQVAPAELEDLLRSHPDVSDAAVIGVPDPASGELPRAYIVRKNPSLTPETINNFLKEKVSSYKQLKGGIEFIDVIPKAPSGKILRRELRKSYTEKLGN